MSVDLTTESLGQGLYIGEEERLLIDGLETKNSTVTTETDKKIMAEATKKAFAVTGFAQISATLETENDVALPEEAVLQTTALAQTAV